MPSIAKKRVNSIAIASAVVALICVSACGKTQSAQALLAEAQQYHQKGDDKAAIIQLKNALQKNPDDAEARFLLGSIYSDAGDAQAAEKELRKAVSLGLSPDKAMPGLAKALLAQNQFQKVLDETQKPESANINITAEVASLRGNAYLGLGKLGDAKDAFNAALKDKPDYPFALTGLARIALAQKDVDGAVNLVEQAVAKNPKHIDGWLLKGDLLRAQGKNDAARAAYDEVLKIQPGNTTAHLVKAYMDIAGGKYVEAKANIDAARKSSPNNLSALYTQALLDYTQKNNSAALESLQQVLRVAPDHMPSVLLAGAVQYALGSTQQAEQHLKKYIDSNPDNVYARKLLVASLLKNGQTQRATTMLEPLLSGRQPDAEIMQLAGQVYTQAKDFAKATTYFEQASAMAPQNAGAHTALAMSKLQQGDSQRAVAELEKATSLDSKSTESGVLLVMTHLRLKEYDKALSAVKALEKEQPDNPLVYNLKGGVYLGKHDPASARTAFEKALALQPTYFAAVENLARLDMQDKKPEAARKRFETLLEKDAKSIPAMVALSNMSAAAGKNDEAKTWLERASNANPGALQPAQLLIAHHLRIGDKQGAQTLATKLQSSNPDKPEYLELLAQTQLASGDKNAALDSYGKLAAVRPESAALQLHIAGINASMQNDAAADAALKKAARLEPNNTEVQLSLAASALRKGNFDEALSIARQLQQRQPNSPLGYALEGDTLLAQKKPAPAVKAFEQAFALGRNGALMTKLHGALVQAGDAKTADARLAQWVKDNPNDIRARAYLADQHLMAKRYKAAMEQLQAILQVDPKNLIAINNLAWAYGEEKDARGLEYAEKALQLAPENPTVLDTLGWILSQQGNTKRGIPLLRKAVSMAPEAMEIRYHLVQALVKAGDKTSARQELEPVLASKKPFSKADEAKALLNEL